MDLAEHGTGALPYDGRRTIAVDLHREEIADALRDRGYAVATDVGLSDFKVDISLASLDAPDRPSMAILLDSPCLDGAADSGGPGRPAGRSTYPHDALAIGSAGVAAGLDQRPRSSVGQVGDRVR